MQELNPRGTHLLFRDKKRQLSLFQIAKQERTTLLNYSGYVQWVPQVRGGMCVCVHVYASLGGFVLWMRAQSTRGSLLCLTCFLSVVWAADLVREGAASDHLVAYPGVGIAWRPVFLASLQGLTARGWLAVKRCGNG